MTVNLEAQHYQDHAIPLLTEGFRFLAEMGSNETYDDENGDGEHYATDEGHGFGVHITFNDLFHSFVFLSCIYVSGQLSVRLLKMPDLVGQIMCGILLGPNLGDFVPIPTAWVLLGEMGLVLLVLEAGIDIDLDMLKLIGARGFLIATVGSLLPIGIGIAIAIAIGTDTRGAIAAGAAFGPTSLGIALNILRSGGILNTPVGQLIVAAAIIDDMIALVILSVLESLTVALTVSSILVPIVSALCFLIIGGYLAIYQAPQFIHRFVLDKMEEQYYPKIELGIMFGLLLALLPATYYCKSSFLMGAFLAGLVFCRSHGLHAIYVSQFKRILAWLMRIFFAASIGFQVPIKEFASGTVIWQGLMFTMALAGKLAVGFLVPNFTQEKRFTEVHFRDCIMTGFSMAAEGEFAFVIAVFAFDSDLISTELYASIVMAILLSTIMAPFCLRRSMNHYNKKAEEAFRKEAEEELKRLDEKQKSDLDLVEGIRKHSTFFLCIQTQSESSWGIMHKIMNCMKEFGLEVIDHRSWHPRRINTTLVNEIYCKGTIDPEMFANANELSITFMQTKMDEVRNALTEVINQPKVARVRVQRWYPGVLEELVEEVEVRTEKTKRNVSIHDALLSEATANLEKKCLLQLAATKEKTVGVLLKDGERCVPDTAGVSELPEVPVGITAYEGLPVEPPKPKTRRYRQKMRSSPAVGGGFFEDSVSGAQRTGREVTQSIVQHREEMTREEEAAEQVSSSAGDLESQVSKEKPTSSLTAASPAPQPKRTRQKMLSVPVRGRLFDTAEPEPSDDDRRAAFEDFWMLHKQKRDQAFAREGPSGIPAEIQVEGEIIKIRVSQETLDNLRKGAAGQIVSGNVFSVTMASEDAPVANMLHGYVRSRPALEKIQEEIVSSVAASEVSDIVNGDVS